MHLTGAIVGSGLLAVGNQVNFAALGKGFVLPLVAGPFLAIALGALLYVIFHGARIGLGRDQGMVRLRRLRRTRRCAAATRLGLKHESGARDDDPERR